MAPARRSSLIRRGSASRANASCRAVLRGDKYYVTGNKKYITNGMYAKFFVVVVVTEGKGGHNGQSLLLVERDSENFQVRKIRP